VTATHLPRISAAALAAAATRLAGAVVLFLEDSTVGAAIYRPRLDAFQSIEGDDVWADDGTIVVLVQPGDAADLIRDHGTPGRAADARNRELRAEWSA
jgi:hypothetical protein